MIINADDCTDDCDHMTHLSVYSSIHTVYVRPNKHPFINALIHLSNNKPIHLYSSLHTLHY